MTDLTLDQAAIELMRSPKFQAWGKPTHIETSYLVKEATEDHFTPDSLADKWGVSAETVRIIFRNEPGVLRITQPGLGKRKYVLLRIPESVAVRVHKRLSAVPQ
jgi:hypothetical protein